MGSSERINEFAFLFANGTTHRLSEDQPAALSVMDQLRKLRRVFSENDLDVYVVQITTPAVRRLGLHAFKVIIPGLMPFSYHYRARFLAHPRLTSRLIDAQGRSKLPNPLPQPFA